MELTNCVLGKTSGEVRLQDRSTIRAACVQMAAQTTRELRICSPDLDAPLYDNADFSDSVRQLALRSRRVPVKILVLDTEPALRQGHRLVELSRLLTSRVQIRRVPEELDRQVEAYLTADDKGYVLRPSAGYFDGSADFFAPMRSRYMRREFEHIWERSSQPLDFIAFGRGL